MSSAPISNPTTTTLGHDSETTSVVQTRMTFLKRDSLWDIEKPYRMRYQPLGDIPQMNLKLEALPVALPDMRPSLNQLSLDVNGFEVHRLSTPLAYDDFFDHNKVMEEYMPELRALVKRVCHAKHVHTLDYEIRKRHETFPISTGRQYDFGQPSLITHVDVTVEATKDIVRALYGPSADEILQSRVQCVTVWKPLRGPVFDWPLALCDARSLTKGDVVPTDVVYRRVVTENGMLHHNPKQEWYFLDSQEEHEAHIFKAADSAGPALACCAHGSFPLPDSANSPPRESIDVRVLVMHADTVYPAEAEWFTE